MQQIILATKSGATLISRILTISRALVLYYFLQVVSCRYTIHVPLQCTWQTLLMLLKTHVVMLW